MIDYHRLFYCNVIAPLIDIVTDTKSMDDKGIIMGHPLPKGRFTHNYERADWISTRDNLIIGYVRHGEEREYTILVEKKHNSDSVTLYKNAVKFMFEDYDIAFYELHTLLSKFFTVKISDFSNYNKIDISDGNDQIIRRLYEV